MRARSRRLGVLVLVLGTCAVTAGCGGGTAEPAARAGSGAVHHRHAFPRGLLALQRRVEPLAGALQRMMGRRYAGFWYDHADIQLKVAVPRMFTPAGRRLASRIRALVHRARADADVTLVPVVWTWYELGAGQQWLDRQIAGLFKRGKVITSSDPIANAVEVTLARGVSGRDRATLDAAIAQMRVKVRVIHSHRSDLTAHAF